MHKMRDTVYEVPFLSIDMYTYTVIYICVYPYIHICISIYACTRCVKPCMRYHVLTDMYMYTGIHIHVYIYAYICICILMHKMRDTVRDVEFLCTNI